MNRSASILAIDLGTTNFKAAAFTNDGHLVACVRRRTPSTSCRFRVEMSVNAMLTSVMGLVDDLREADTMSAVRAVSFATQANSFALFDESSEPLTPIILWTDARAAGDGFVLDTPERLQSISGVPGIDHEFAAAKLAWLAKHEPAIADRARKISFISDVLTEWLTGVHATDAGVACLTALAAQASRSWNDQLIRFLGMPSVVWPRILEAGTDVGPILPNIAERLGLAEGARLYIGCLDQYAGAIGAGAVKPGDVCVTNGTVLSAVQCATVGMAGSLPVFEGPSFSPDRQWRMAFSDVSARLLDEYRRTAAPHLTIEHLIGSATSEQESDDGTVIRGILSRVCDEVDRLLNDLGGPCNAIHVAGGGARSDVWLQQIAERVRVPVLAASVEEPTCRGAAMLAARGIGLGTIESLAASWCTPCKTFIPAREVIDVRT